MILVSIYMNLVCPNSALKGQNQLQLDEVAPLLDLFFSPAQSPFGPYIVAPSLPHSGCYLISEPRLAWLSRKSNKPLIERKRGKTVQMFVETEVNRLYKQESDDLIRFGM